MNALALQITVHHRRVEMASRVAAQAMTALKDLSNVPPLCCQQLHCQAISNRA